MFKSSVHSAPTLMNEIISSAAQFHFRGHQRPALEQSQVNKGHLHKVVPVTLAVDLFLLMLMFDIKYPGKEIWKNGISATKFKEKLS